VTTLLVSRQIGEYLVLSNSRGFEVKILIKRATRSGSIIVQTNDGKFGVRLSGELWEVRMGRKSYVRVGMHIAEDDHHRIEISFPELPDWIEVLRERNLVVEDGVEVFR